MNTVPIELGARCNNRCVHCALGERRASDAVPTDEGVQEQLGAGARAITFVGGEPTLHDGLPRWIAMARKAGCTAIAIQSNARRMSYPAYARALAEAGLTGLETSLYGASAPAHDYHTRAPGSFEQTCAGARNARAQRIELYVTLLATRSSWRDLPASAGIAIDLGAAAIRLAVVQPVGAAGDAVDRVIPRAGMMTDAIAAVAQACAAARVPLVTDDTPAHPGFAGLVRSAPARPAPPRAAPVDPSLVQLRALGAPNPGKREQRDAAARKTGDELRTLFPSLFEGGEPPSGKAR